MKKKEVSFSDTYLETYSGDDNGEIFDQWRDLREKYSIDTLNGCLDTLRMLIKFGDDDEDGLRVYGRFQELLKESDELVVKEFEEKCRGLVGILDLPGFKELLE